MEAIKGCIKRNFHRGLNSQGTLLLPAKSIENIKTNKFSLVLRTISVYTLWAHKIGKEELSNLRKTSALALKEQKIEHSDIVYIAKSYLDKEKVGILLQAFVRISCPQGTKIVVLEKSSKRSVKESMWRLLGII